MFPIVGIYLILIAFVDLENASFKRTKTFRVFAFINYIGNLDRRCVII